MNQELNLIEAANELGVTRNQMATMERWGLKVLRRKAHETRVRHRDLLHFKEHTLKLRKEFYGKQFGAKKKKQEYFPCDSFGLSVSMIGALSQDSTIRKRIEDGVLLFHYEDVLLER